MSTAAGPTRSATARCSSRTWPTRGSTGRTRALRLSRSRRRPTRRSGSQTVRSRPTADGGSVCASVTTSARRWSMSSTSWWPCRRTARRIRARSSGGTTSSHRRASPRTGPRWRGFRGTCRGCRGTAPSCSLRRSRSRRSSATPHRSRGVRVRSRSGTRNGALPEISCSRRTAAVGGTSNVCATVSAPWCSRPRRSSATRSGAWVSTRSRSWATGASRVTTTATAPRTRRSSIPRRGSSSTWTCRWTRCDGAPGSGPKAQPSCSRPGRQRNRIR